MAVRFSALLERSGWGTAELAIALGYGSGSRSTIMRWKRGLAASTFRDYIPQLVRLLECPQDLDIEAKADSAARLKWIDPLDRDGIQKLVAGILEEPEDSTWFERLYRSAPARVTRRNRYRSLRPGDDRRARIEMKLQNRDDSFGDWHRYVHRFLQNNEDPDVYVVGRHFSQAPRAGESKPVVLDIPGEADFIERMLFHTLGVMIEAAVEEPDKPPRVPRYTSSPTGWSYELVDPPAPILDPDH